MKVGETSGNVVKQTRFGIYRGQVLCWILYKEQRDLGNPLSKRIVGWDIGTSRTHETGFVGLQLGDS